MKRNRKSMRGLNLLEAMIAFAILSIILAVGVAGLSNGCAYLSSAGSKEDAEAAGRAYLIKLRYESPVVDCVDVDSDGDGYLSCTGSAKKDGHEQTVAMECARKLSVQSGCRMQKPATPRLQVSD